MMGDKKRKAEVQSIKKEPTVDDTAVDDIKPVKKKRSAEYEAMKARLKKEADEARELKKKEGPKVQQQSKLQKYPRMGCPP
jgi:hypothetical protein